MMIEWDIHNQAYDLLNLLPFGTPWFTRAKDVDLDIESEELSKWEHITKAIWN